MARNTSEAKEQATSLLKCPHCGSADTDEMLLKQMLPTTFYILVSDDGIEVDTASMSTDYDSVEKDVLLCTACHQDFDIPSEFDITYA